MIFTVTPELYREAAERLAEAVGASSYYSGSVAFAAGAVDCRLTLSVLVYRRRSDAPDGSVHVLADLVPVWWEFHTMAAEGEVWNDFSFSELKTYMLDGCR